ncbi:PREDICTED: DNA (cytosine-5)-methyltransferase 1-like, partial [Gekko japonicus]|uniref:DNA (Cytosine-5)-methyltransferase 1-like n=1 Tax=Gekko japonicus TaxID=146911 RepID=A0ABM1KS32_GEKJA
MAAFIQGESKARRPEKCCEECVPAKGSCVHEGSVRYHKEMWSGPRCEFCVCDTGQVSCWKGECAKVECAVITSFALLFGASGRHTLPFDGGHPFREREGGVVGHPVLTVTPNNYRLKDLERGEDGLSERECIKEKLHLMQGFLRVDIQNQLKDLEAQLHQEELSEERYLAQVKALLPKELSLENGDAPELGQKPNGYAENGTCGSDDESERPCRKGVEDAAMETEEATASSSSSSATLASPTVSKARRGRRSKSNGENRKSPGSSRVTRSSGKQPTIVAMFSK